MRRWGVATVLAVAMVGIGSPAQAQTAGQLDRDGPDYDGATVTVEGELIGDFGRHSGAVWAQLNDDPYARRPLLETGELAGSNISVALRVPVLLFDLAIADRPGGYRYRGPLVRATGIYRYHDPQRGGESYLDVAELELIEPGRELHEAGSTGAAVAGAVLLLLSFTLLGLDRLRNRE